MTGCADVRIRSNLFNSHWKKKHGREDLDLSGNKITVGSTRSSVS